MAEESVATAVDQESFLNDYFTDTGGNEETPAPSAETKTETPNSTPEKKEETVADPNASEEAAKPEAKPEAEVKQDDFSFVKTNEQGESIFDAEAALDFATKDSSGQERQPYAYNRPAPEAPKPADPTDPAQAPAQTYQDNVKNGTFYYKNVLQQFVNQGHDVNTAMALADAQVEKEVNEHLQDYRFKQMEEKLSAREQAIVEKQETAQLQPRSTANMMEVAKGYKSINQFKDMIFRKEFGGDMVLKMFDLQNPDKKGLVGDEFRGALEGWFTKFSSNIENLRMVEEVARARVLIKSMPQMIKHISGVKDKNIVAKEKAQMTPSNLNRPGREQNDTVSELEGWINEVPTQTKK